MDPSVKLYLVQGCPQSQYSSAGLNSQELHDDEHLYRNDSLRAWVESKKASEVPNSSRYKDEQ
jgi:hypothetical protein